MELFGEAPANRTARWEPGPNTRGSMSILLSCIITLGLCVWTSVHLNIPERGEDKPRHWVDPRGWVSKQKWRKVAWLLVGMLAPEYVTFTAWSQWRLARKMNRKMLSTLYAQTSTNAGRSEPAGKGDLETNLTAVRPPRKHDWTMMHSFYATMGGFVYDFSDLPDDEQFLPTSGRRRTFTPEGLEQLAIHHPSAMPDISTAYIQDKSNADGLTKAIVCVQATWFVMQCLVRLGERLPISLLEINTLAHCICTLLTYVFWWSKPLDIEEPTRISSPEIHGLCAELFIGCHEGDLYPQWIRLFADTMRPAGHLPFAAIFQHHLIQADGQGVLYPGQKIHGFWYMPRSCCARHASYGYHRHTPYNGIFGHQKPSKICSSLDYRRYALASASAKLDGKFFDVNTRSQLGIARRMTNVTSLSTLLQVRDNNDLDVTDFLRSESAGALFALFLAGAFYGGIHLLAWDAPFTSHAQSVFWQISGIVVAGAAFVIVLEHLVSFSLAYFDAQLEFAGGLPLLLVRVIMFVFLRIFYILARFYLLVEALISFAYLPPGVFREPQWTYFVPHFS